MRRFLVACVVWLALFTPALSAVTVSATGTATYNSTATTQDFTFSVNASDTLAIFFIAQDITQGITSVTWDNGGTNQAATVIGSKSDPTATTGAIYLYGVVNPTSGTHTLRVVNALTTPESAELQSYTGTVTTSVVAACTNVLTLNGTTGAGADVGTAAQSGVSGDMYISGYVSGGAINSVSDISIYILAPAGDDAGANRFASTGTSHALTANMGGGTQWAAVSCDIVASTGTVVTPMRTLMGVGQ